MDPSWVPRWRSDLAFMADSLPSRHPNFFHAVSRERYRAALDSLSARLPGLAQHQVVVELARIVAMVGDGHTRLTLPWDPGAGFFTGHAATDPAKVDVVFRQYPIRLGLFGDSLCVIRADSTHRDLLGGRVVRIGERSAEEAMAAVEPTISRDNRSQMRGLLPISLVCPEILEARGVVRDMERATIVVERDGRRIEAVLAPAPLGRAVAWIEARDMKEPMLRDRNPDRSHWFTLLPGTKTVYARYRAVMDDKDESVAAFADSLFAAVERKRADRLILDLRGNVGGNGFLNKALLQHLIRAERLYRPGGLWALVDRGSFSAAVMLAADLEMRTPTVLVGEETGGHPNSWGDAKRVVLPQSGLTVRVSSLYWQLTSPQDRREAIVPHVRIDETFADWRAGRDPALEAAAAGPGRGDLAGRWKGAMAIQFDRGEFALRLLHRGSAWSGTVDMPDADLHDAPLGATQVNAGTLVTHWGPEGKTTFRARLTGERLVGLLRYAGVDFPVVLERVPESAARSEPAAR